MYYILYLLGLYTYDEPVAPIPIIKKITNDKMCLSGWDKVIEELKEVIKSRYID
jgi:hypothetical protein